MGISIVVAMDNQGVIGCAGGLPWHLSADLIYFKTITMGKPLIMGRKTHQSIGRPLPGRKNIILTHRQDFFVPACKIVHSLESALLEAGNADEIMIMGGASIYAQSLPQTDRIYLTEVHADVKGDTYFPEFDKRQWLEVRRETHPGDEKNDCNYSFVVLERS